ncbi:MAG: hypothetical protein JXO49_09200 [Deltaproteobacteria bacterium]|nr:hypothetical protein [Candidatus Anaeroferrophillus wilburensis]MBN2889506.1 hypothetical protein [Deltaproteobacteria bacterium]
MLDFSDSYPDFTLPMYEQLCQTVLDHHFVIKTIHEAVNKTQRNSPALIFRHDVDRQPHTALNMAKLEHRLGIKASYYFRFVQGVYIPEIIKEIHAMGHEIGYHYETLSKCNGDYDRAILLFQKELAEFRSLCPVTTISMHGRPLSPYDNRTLWQRYDFKTFGIAGECYLSLDYQAITYLSDTGRTWNPHRYNVRDRVDQAPLPPLESTSDLISYLSGEHHRDICILTHPNRWTTTKSEWLFSACSDFLINQGKRIIISLRRR